MIRSHEADRNETWWVSQVKMADSYYFPCEKRYIPYNYKRLLERKIRKAYVAYR